VIEESSVVSDVLIARNYHKLKPVRRGQAQNDHYHRCKRADDGCDNLDHYFALFLKTDGWNNIKLHRLVAEVQW